MARGKGKGSQFERSVCERLSAWATNGKRDDIFWRSHGSGNRATSRGKAGKRTKGQYGDICATDPIGIPFLDVVTIELKRGYSTHTIGEILDKDTHTLVQVMETWFSQAIHSHEDAGSFAWMIVHKRDQRAAMVYFPIHLYDALYDSDPEPFDYQYPFAQARVHIHAIAEPVEFVIMRFEDFLNATSIEQFEEISRRN